jgi:16S rRNA (cytosine967-C5)-methyltransferase
VQELVKQPRNDAATTTEAIRRVSNQPGPISICRNNLRCTSDADLIGALGDHNVQVEPLRELCLHTQDGIWPTPKGCLRMTSSTSIWFMPAWMDGWFEVQDTGSQLIVAATEAKAGDVIVDYCAGNGGKTLALASSAFDSSTTSDTTTVIWAHDIVKARLAQLVGSYSRAGITERGGTILTTANATVDLRDSMADVVLVDAPCSSTGVLRRRPSQRWAISCQEATKTLPDLQLQILLDASRLVKPGGRLVYSTCSILKYENEDVVQMFENQLKVDSTWVQWDFETEFWPLQKGIASHCRLLLPGKHDSDGFFMARWKRKS